MEKQSKAKRTAIYAMAFGEEMTGDGIYIELQRQAAKEYCNSPEHDIVAEYIDAEVLDVSVPPKKALLQLLKDAREGGFDEVVIWKTDRVGSDLVEFFQFMFFLRDHNVSIISVHDGIDTSTIDGKRRVIAMMGFKMVLMRRGITADKLDELLKTHKVTVEEIDEEISNEIGNVLKQVREANSRGGN